MGRVLLALVSTLFLVMSVTAGTWTSNNFLYQPGAGARGDEEKAKFDSGLNRVDSRLANEKWLNDPLYNGDLATAITAIDSAKAVLSIPAGNWPIAANLTVPANLTLKVAHGALLTIPTGNTLTINGTLDAGLYQIFTCTGTGKVVFAAGAVKEIRPEWWATNTTPGTTDMQPAIQAAVDAATAGTVRLQSKNYALGNYVTITKHINLKGMGMGTILTRLVSSSGVIITGNDATQTMLSALNGNIGMEDLQIVGQSAFTHDAVKLIYVAAGRFRNVYVGHSGGNGIYMRSVWDCTFDAMLTRYCGNQAAGKAAIYLDEYSPGHSTTNNVNETRFSNSQFEHSTGQLLKSVGNNNNSICFTNCKFEYSNPAVGTAADPIMITGGSGIASNFEFVGCRFTGYIQGAMINATNLHGLFVEAMAWNPSAPATGSVILNNCRAIDLNLIGYYIGNVVKTGNTFYVRENIKDRLRNNLQTVIMRDYEEKQTINLRNTLRPDSGSTIVDDADSPTGYALYAHSTDWAPFFDCPISENQIRNGITVWVRAKADVAGKQFNVNVKSVAGAGGYPALNDVNISTITLKTTYDIYGIVIQPQYLFPNTNLKFVNVSMGGAHVTVAEIWYENKYYAGAAPATGTWNRQDIVWHNAPAPSTTPGWICTTSGTLGTLNGGATTADTTNGSPVITVNSATGLYPGAYITVAGVTGIKKILKISGTTVTVDSNCDATVDDGAVAYSAAVFKAMAALGA
jgi:hypothetical protein